MVATPEHSRVTPQCTRATGPGTADRRRRFVRQRWTVQSRRPLSAPAGSIGRQKREKNGSPVLVPRSQVPGPARVGRVQGADAVDVVGLAEVAMAPRETESSCPAAAYDRW